jgi:hypothetical protein
MKNHFYFEVMRRTIVQFLNLFNDIKIARYDNTGKLLKFISVPLKFAPKEKHWYFEEKYDNINGRTVRNLILPYVAVNMTGVQSAGDKRAVNKHHRVRSKKGTESPIKMDRFENPVPYDFNFEVKIAAQFMIDINQIMEQILPFFDPTAYIRITIPDLNIDHKENDTEEGAYPLDLKVIYEDGSFETNIDMGAEENRILEWTLPFKIEGYLFKPNMETPIIEHALMNYYDTDVYEVYGEDGEPLITTTTTGLSSENWPITITGGTTGAGLSGAIYSDSAKLWYTYERDSLADGET